MKAAAHEIAGVHPTDMHCARRRLLTATQTDLQRKLRRAPDSSRARQVVRAVPAYVHHLHDLRPGRGLAAECVRSLPEDLRALVLGIRQGRAGVGEALGPQWDRANPQPPTHVVTEVAAIPLEDVVALCSPVPLRGADEGEELKLPEGGPPHCKGLDVGVTWAAARPVAEDRGAGSGDGVAVAPLAPEHLHAAVEHTGAQRPQESVELRRAAAGPDVVDVQRHLGRRVRAFSSRFSSRARIGDGDLLERLGAAAVLVLEGRPDARVAHPRPSAGRACPIAEPLAYNAAPSPRAVHALGTRAPGRQVHAQTRETTQSTWHQTCRAAQWLG
eukprot:CAMPEP_0175662754 /NCGR_PEP_ID=MMETSP0097-20121207/15637_1 /TAXON_ID=311494 /ORGANISM="Alexandrium monilatum, Strain CCMP3105" /LENGTH=328 /DNA_ID=CAMNT_0016968967 /DNA_START=100 /DNA_END=1082 /DNA_ORIENTATION=-